MGASTTTDQPKANPNVTVERSITSGAGSNGTGSNGTLVLAHPLVAICVSIWLLNDHVLKAEYASWWTGKLTDVVALVAFPLLVATAVEPFARRPIRIGIGFTAVFYSAINLFPSADTATEWVMSLVVESQLTMDPTDLLVLPALGGAWWIWNSVERSMRSLRRSWGRVVFVIGVGTSMATSPPTAMSETFSGTILLTEDNPSVSIPFTLLLDGDPAETLGPVGVSTTFTSYATRSEAASWAEANDRADRADWPDGPAWNPIAAEIVPIGEGDGSGEAVFTLSDVSLAPVEVTWRMSAYTEGTVGFLFGGDEAEVPELAVQQPPDQRGPAALYELMIEPAGGDAPRVWEWQVVAAPDAELALSVPARTNDGELQVAIDGDPVPIDPGFLSPLPLRPECGATRCAFSLWVGAADAGAFQSLPIRLHGSAESSVTDVRERDLTQTRRTFKTDAVSSDVEQEFVTLHELRFPEPDGPIGAATTFFRVRAEATPPAPDLDDDQLRGVARAQMEGLSIWRTQPSKYCCPPLEVSVELFSYQDRDSYDTASTAATITVELWALDRVDSASIELLPQS